MIAEFLNREIVRDQLAQLQDFVASKRSEDLQAGRSIAGHDALLEELISAQAREEKASTGQPSFAPPESDRRGSGSEPAPLDDFAFVSRDPIVGLLQSALDEYYDQPGNTREVTDQAPADDRRGDGPALVTNRSLVELPAPERVDDRRVFEKFSITDLRWVRSKVAEGIRLFRHRRAFNEEPAKAIELPDAVRLVLVGDWGSGLPRAQQVGKQMRIAIDEGLARNVPVHVIHLGDVYYSGWGHEYRKRFLPYWPVRADEAERVGSWCLNGNHDMYSGGHAYYDVALGDPRFKRWQTDGASATSFFSLVSKHWKILGLDTSWDDGGLKDPQVAWVNDELRTAKDRKTLLLSHHQLFSAYEKGAKVLSEKMRAPLEAHPVTAWFWGHEHRCMLYGPHENVTFGRCLGDGGVPVYQWHRPDALYPPPGTYEHRRFVKSGLEQWAVMGFAVLDFDGPKIEVRYIDETGHEHYKETIG